MKLKESIKKSREFKKFVKRNETQKLEGKYKEFKYKITPSGWEIKHRHFGICHVFDISYPFVKIDKKKGKVKDFDINNKKQVNWVRKYLYRVCERELRNPWWRGLDKPKVKIVSNKTNKEDYEIVMVEWKDITHLNRIPDIEYCKEQGLLNFINVGFKIFENNEILSVAFSKSNEREGQALSIDPFREVLNIPKSNIVKITKLEDSSKP